MWEAEAGRSLEFEASLVYRVSSRIARATQRNPVFKKKKSYFSATPPAHQKTYFLWSFSIKSMENSIFS